VCNFKLNLTKIALINTIRLYIINLIIIGVGLMSRFNIRRVNEILIALLNEMINIRNEDASDKDISKILNFKGKAELEISTIELIFQEIIGIVTQRFQGDAEKTQKYLSDVIEKINLLKGERVSKIADYERDLIIREISKYAIYEKYTQKAVIELLKDLDAVYRYLHGVKFQGAYMERCKKVFEDSTVEEAI
jgi:hypothetical protein